MSVKALRLTNVALVVKPAGKLYEPQLETRRLRDLAEGEVLIRITAAAFNHRDVRKPKFRYQFPARGSNLLLSCHLALDSQESISWHCCRQCVWV